MVKSKSNATVAQSVERGTENPCVGGSIPSRGNFIHPQEIIKHYRENTKLRKHEIEQKTLKLFFRDFVISWLRGLLEMTIFD